MSTYCRWWGWEIAGEHEIAGRAAKEQVFLQQHREMIADSPGSAKSPLCPCRIKMQHKIGFRQGYLYSGAIQFIPEPSWLMDESGLPTNVSNSYWPQMKAKESLLCEYWKILQQEKRLKEKWVRKMGKSSEWVGRIGSRTCSAETRIN